MSTRSYTHYEGTPPWGLDVGHDFLTLSYSGPHIATDVEVEFIEHWNEPATSVTSHVESASALATGHGSLAFALVTWPGHTHVNLPRSFGYRVRWVSPEGQAYVYEEHNLRPSS